MNHKVAILIPDSDHYVRKAMQLMAKLFGGFTAIPAKGGWVSATNGLIIEDVTLIFSACDNQTLTNSLPQIKVLAQDIAEGLNQECVALEVDGCMEFVMAKVALAA